MSNINFEVDSTALSAISTAIIPANWDEVKAGLGEMVAPYKNMVVSEDAISSAKTDRASINKVIKNIDEYRKTVKKIASQPIVEFENHCKELTAVCRGAMDNLDEQIKSFAEEERAAKLAELRGYFESKTISHPEYITFDTIAQANWGNKTYSTEQAHYDIDNAIRQNDLDVDTIMKLNPNHVPALLEKYKETRNIYAVLSLDEKLTEREKTVAKPKDEPKPVEKIQYETPVVYDEVPPMQELEEAVEPVSKHEPMFSVAFEVTCTESDIRAIQNLLDSRRIKWRVI